MALVAALFSAKGSPGTTTLGEALVAVLSRDRLAVLAELDPDGGDRATVPGLALQPGLASLAVAARHGSVSEELFAAHLQALPAGGHVLVGPASSDQAHAALTSLVPQLGPVLADFASCVIADCGRARSRSPSVEIACHAHLTVIVTHPTLEGVAHARQRVAALDEAGARVGVVLVGRRPYGPGEVSAAVGAPVLGVVAHDPAGAQLLRSGQGASRAGRRSLLMRSVVTLAAHLVEERSSVSVARA